MRFVDNRRHTDVPLPEDLIHLAGHLLVHSDDAQHQGGIRELYVRVADYDQSTGNVVHFQLNFEPAWLDEEFRATWRRQAGTVLRSEQVQHTAPARFVWGVWVER